MRWSNSSKIKRVRSTVMGLVIGCAIGNWPMMSNADTGNLRVSPLGIMMGAVRADLDLGIGAGFTLGPSIQYMYSSKMFGMMSGMMGGSPSMKSLGYGVRANYYLGRTQFSEGWLIGAFVHYMPVSATSGDFRGDVFGFGAGALAGYQWFWDSFNIGLGAGLTYYTMNSDILMKNHMGAMQTMSNGRLSGVMPHIEATVGWKF